MTLRSPHVVATGLLTAVLFIAPAQAGPYSAIYAFGDSLSDTGNVFALTGAPAAPYVNGQFSNGNVWLQTLASQAGLAPLKNSLSSGGTDYAYGGAQTGTTVNHTASFIDLWGSGGQVDQFKLTHASADPNALYTIWIGSNDLNAIPGSATQAQATQAAAQAIGNIDSAINALAGTGAKNFLVVTVPDLGKTPGVLAAGAAASQQASLVAATFNSVLVNGNANFGLPSLGGIAGSLGLNIKVLDTYSLMDTVVGNPAAYGLTNVTSACFTGSYTGGPGSGTLCSPTVAGQNQYFFWDSLHPTAGTHALIGAAAATLLAVPEAQTWAMLLAGLGVLGFVARRRKVDAQLAVPAAA